MSSLQINVRTSPLIAINEALKFLIRRYKAMKTAEQIESLSKNVETDGYAEGFS